jgi:hypothetical protein
MAFMNFVRVFFSGRATPQKFGVDFGKLREPPLKFQVRGDASAGLFTLRGRFEQELSHPAGAQALHQIVKRAVLESPTAAAVFFAAGQVLYDERRPQHSGRHWHLPQQGGLSLLEDFGRHFPQINCLNHIKS